MSDATATKLIRTLGSSTDELVPPYETELIEKLKTEANICWNEMLEINESATTPHPSTSEEETYGKSKLTKSQEQVVGVHYTGMDWAKRCIIAYHFIRLNRLKRLRWDYGNTLPEEIKKNMSVQEREWYEKYNDNLFNYMKNLGHGGLDLTLYMRPPKKLFINVKCIKELGQIDLDNGQQVILKKDTVLNLPLSQCEKLIHQGILEQTLS